MSVAVGFCSRNKRHQPSQPRQISFRITFGCGKNIIVLRIFTHLTDQNLLTIKDRAESLRNKIASNDSLSGRDKPRGDRWYRLSYNPGSSHPKRFRNR